MSNKLLNHAPFTELHLRTGPLQVEFTFNCIDCKKDFQARSGHAKRCNECKKKFLREYHRKYQKTYKEKT